jgi:hypothetical protein
MAKPLENRPPPDANRKATMLKSNMQSTGHTAGAGGRRSPSS